MITLEEVIEVPRSVEEYFHYVTDLHDRRMGCNGC